MQNGAFDVVVSRYLGGRSERSVLLAAGLPAKAIDNVRRNKGVPAPGRLSQLAAALEAPVPVLTRAVLIDAGYQLGDEAPLDRELGLLLAAMDEATREATMDIVRIMRNRAVHAHR